jgi:hypothetical protein
MDKRDLKKELKEAYQPSAKEVTQLDVPPMRFLMVDGAGDPNASAEYKKAVETLFGVSYALKFAVKKSKLAIDYGVMPLEGLWWADDMTRFSVEDKRNWKWTMMIAQPDFASDDMAQVAIAATRKKKGPDGMAPVRLQTFAEGTCAQILHVGPFSAEGPTIAKVHAFIAARGSLRGKHHEIYLSDITKADPAKWKTIIRQPFAAG